MIWKRWLRSERSRDEAATEELEPSLATVNNGPGSLADQPETADVASMVASPRFGGETRPAFLDTLWRQQTEMARNQVLPRFAATASDDVDSADIDAAMSRRKLALRDALGASQPVIGRESFAGRHDALSQLISSIEQQRVHVVIYGERGIGKTSLSHVFAETAREARYLVLYGSCGTEAQFDTMFRSFAARIPRLYHKSILPNSPEAEAGDHFDVMLEEHFGPRELAELFAEVTGTRVIIIPD